MAQPGSFMSISEADKLILSKAKDQLLTSLNESCLVSPTEHLSKRKPTDDKISAPHLTIGPGTNTYFIEKNLKTALNENVPSFEELQENLDHVFTESMKEITTLISPHFYVCQGKILTKLGRCGSKIHNKAEVHYVIGDPIMEMLCTIFKLEERLEESIWGLGHSFCKQTEAEQANQAAQDEDMESEKEEGTAEEASCKTPHPPTTRSKRFGEQTHGTSTAKSVSLPDYTCYTLRNTNQSIVAIIIETKLTSHSQFHHAVAQIIGYYIALTSEDTPPLVFVLSKEDIQIVIFPFVDTNNEGLINAVKFVKVNLWLSTDFNLSALGILYLVLRSTVQDLYTGKFLKYTYSDAVPKRALVKLVDVWDETLKLQKEIKETQKEIKEMKKEYKEMQKELEKWEEEKKEMQKKLEENKEMQKELEKWEEIQKELEKREEEKKEMQKKLEENKEMQKKLEKWEKDAQKICDHARYWYF